MNDTFAIQYMHTNVACRQLNVVCGASVKVLVGTIYTAVLSDLDILIHQ